MQSIEMEKSWERYARRWQERTRRGAEGNNFLYLDASKNFSVHEKRDSVSPECNEHDKWTRYIDPVNRAENKLGYLLSWTQVVDLT